MAHAEVLSRGDTGPLCCLFSATAIGQAGNMMTVVAGPWFGTVQVMAFALIPVRSVLDGVSIRRFGTVPTIVGMGAVYLVVTIAAFSNPLLRAMHEPAGDVLVDEVPDRSRLPTP
jgi:hypothetical protein